MTVPPTNEKWPGPAARLRLQLTRQRIRSSPRSHTLASKMRAAFFPAAQSDRSPLSGKVQWKVAVVTPPLCAIQQRLWQKASFHCQVREEQRGAESDIPGLALPAGVKRCTSGRCSHSLRGHWLCARHCVKPLSMVVLCIHGALGDGAGSRAKNDLNSSKFPRDSEKGEINAAWQCRRRRPRRGPP